jgi:NAD-dependent deacetylase
MDAKKKPCGLDDIARSMTAPGSRTVIFTGAGMSTDSGLTDFRSQNGLWTKVDPMELATPQAMRGNYEFFHEFYSRRFKTMGAVSPNIGHDIIADWEARGLVDCVITQNIDGLHAKAGSKKIHELHGSVSKVLCMDCKEPSTHDAFIDRVPCKSCGGKLRPGVVLFGEQLPEDAMDLSWTASERATVFIVLGSSLNVSPANQFPITAHSAGALLVICNRDSTYLDGMADFRTRDGIGDFLPELDGAIKTLKTRA